MFVLHDGVGLGAVDRARSQVNLVSGHVEGGDPLDVAKTHEVVGRDVHEIEVCMGGKGKKT